MSGAAPPRLLVVGPAWVGDMIMAQSLFMTLKQRDPTARIQVLAPGWTHPLLERMPQVEDAIELPLGHGHLGLGQRRRLGRQLRERGFTRAILLPNSWKSALIPWWARIPLRTGWLGELRYGLLNDIRRLDRERLPTTVQRFVALADAPGHIPPSPSGLPRPQLEVDPASLQRVLQRLGLPRPAQRRLLALCPGAEFGPAKRWPADFYGQVARHLHQQGWAVWLFGSANDRSVCAEVNDASGGLCTDLSGRTALGEAVDLLSLADLVVSNDSGLMHVAAALGHPLVAIFGSSDPHHTPPLSERAGVVTLDLECSPCFRRTCPLEHTDCLRRLTPERVLAAAKALLA